MPCKRWAVALRPSRRMSGLVARWQTFGRQHHPGAVDLSADSGRRVPLRSRQAVAVDPQRDRRVGVAQAGAHDVDRDPGQQCQRRADVAQVVQPDGGQLRSPDGTLERQADSRGPQRLAHLGREHVAAVGPGRSSGQPLLGLLSDMRLQPRPDQRPRAERARQRAQGRPREESPPTCPQERRCPPGRVPGTTQNRTGKNSLK